MKRINEWIALLTNIGLLFGIVFLVYELDQNSLNQQMEARFFIAQSFSDFNSSVAENPQLASLLTKAEGSETELTPAEARQYFHHYARWMQILNRASEMHQEDVLSDGAWREYICIYTFLSPDTTGR